MLFKFLKIGLKSKTHWTIITIVLLAIFMIFSTLSALRIEELYKEKEELSNSVEIRCSLDADKSSTKIDWYAVSQFDDDKYGYLVSNLDKRTYHELDFADKEKGFLYGMNLAKDIKFDYFKKAEIDWNAGFDESFLEDETQQGVLVPYGFLGLGLEDMTANERATEISFALSYPKEHVEGEAEVDSGFKNFLIAGYYKPLSEEELKEVGLNSNNYLFTHNKMLSAIVDMTNKVIEKRGIKVREKTELFEFVLSDNRFLPEILEISDSIKLFYEENKGGLSKTNPPVLVVDDYFYEKQLLQVNSYITREKAKLSIFVLLTFAAGLGMSFVLSYMRSQERALMRTLGVSKMQLLWSTLFGSVLITLFAFVISFVAVYGNKGMISFQYYHYSLAEIALYLLSTVLAGVINNRKNLLLEVKKTIM